VKKLFSGRVEPKPNLFKSDWNDGHKEYIAGAIDYHNPYRSEHLVAAKQAQLSKNQCHDDLTSCNSLIYWGPIRKIMPGWRKSAVRRLPTPALRGNVRPADACSMLDENQLLVYINHGVCVTMLYDSILHLQPTTRFWKVRPCTFSWAANSAASHKCLTL